MRETKGRSFTFGLPPSMGPAKAQVMADDFMGVLGDVGFSSVLVQPTYEALESALVQGDVDVAWGPPMVCGTVERAGGLVAWRAVREEKATYRSALLGRASDNLTFEELLEPKLPDFQKLRLAWVDNRSMAGHIMPRYLLLAHGAPMADTFESEEFYGSYRACFEAVLDGRADITASYASERHVGYLDLCGDRADELTILSYTVQCDNDGIVIGPHAMQHATEILNNLGAMLRNPQTRDIFCRALDVDGFKKSRSNSYVGLLDLIP